MRRVAAQTEPRCYFVLVAAHRVCLLPRIGSKLSSCVIVDMLGIADYSRGSAQTPLRALPTHRSEATSYNYSRIP